MVSRVIDPLSLADRILDLIESSITIEVETPVVHITWETVLVDLGPESDDIKSAIEDAIILAPKEAEAVQIIPSTLRYQIESLIKGEVHS